MSFKVAVEAVGEPVKSAYRPGKQALPKAHAKQVSCADERRIHGSIFLDKALEKVGEFSQEPRWDYGLGYTTPSGREVAIWVEVHTASTDQVRAVIKKKKWLRDYLVNNAERLWKMTPPESSPLDPYVWVASNGVHINQNSSQARLLAASGISWPKRSLMLD